MGGADRGTELRRDALRLDSKDNVATAVRVLRAGETVAVDGQAVSLSEDIPYGHKFALVPIARGQAVVKYGQRIGVAGSAIGVGEHVHVHNVVSERGRGDLGRSDRA